MTEIHWTEVENVTTVWTDAPPPLRAGLLFRTGQADETLTTSGQTHLIEHLAFSAVSDPAHRHNGFTGGILTGFFTIGTAQEVYGFLASICESLSSLPANHLEDQKKILEAESAAQNYNFTSNLLMWRYGASGYGLMGLRQPGLRRVTIDQLQKYSARRFTKENAVLWLSGPPPNDLRLNLPHGMKRPLPPLAPIQPDYPCWLVDNACGGVAAGATVPRVSAATVFCVLANNRLQERLRTVQAISYAPMVFYDALDAGTAHLVLYADSDKDHRKELAGKFGEIFEGLGNADAPEVDTVRQQVLDHMTGVLAPPPAEQMVMEVQRAAMDWIFGREFDTTEVLVDELMAVTASDVAKFGCDFQATAMLAVPGQATVESWMGKRAPVSTGSVMHGLTYASVDAPIQPERLVSAPQGVSLVWPDGSHVTVRYAELAAALYFEDGCITLIGADAAAITIEPTLWRDGKNLCRAVRERVPAHLLLPQGSRSVEAIPRPETTAWQRLRATLARR